MFSSIASQIKKLDKELDGCKERLHALRISQEKDAVDFCKVSKVKKVKRSRSAMNRKKIPAEREYETTCKKNCKAQKKLPDKCKRSRDIIDTPVNKTSVKPKQRSRSASCGKDFECDCASENNYLHNDLGPHRTKQDMEVKNSWANILKDYNAQNSNRNDACTDRIRDHKVHNHTSIYLKNRGIQCSESSFIPSRTTSGLAGFTPYNPTRTLQFLLSEIRENLKHNQEDKVLNIINDMEDTIYRLKFKPDNVQQGEVKNHSYQPYKESFLNNNVHYNQDVNKVFEEGFAKLEGTCKTLEITCARLKEENKQLQVEMERKDACISLLEKKEKDHLEKINVLNDHIICISQKGEQSSETVKELTKLLSKVQQDIKCIEPLRKQNAELEAKVALAVKENSQYIYDNHILKLENEKLKVLLEVKEKQLFNYKEVFCNLEDKVKNGVKVMQAKCVSDDSDPDTSAPLCSSPNTSGSILAPAYGSWCRLSRVSSNADINRPDNLDFLLPHKDIQQPVESNKNKSTVKNFGSPREYYNNAAPRFKDSPPEEQIGGIDGLRGQIKMLFSDQFSQSKVKAHNPNAQPQWTNLNTIHSSITSYNTTS